MDTFPLESDPLPLNGEESIDPTDPNKKIQHTYDGWLIHFDELPSAPQALQAASYKIMLEREVGSHRLHPNVYIAASGNNESDNAVTFEMSTALQSRLIHLDLEPNVEDFVANARAFKFDSRVIAFVQYRPALLDNFKPDHADKTFACSRTWEFTSSLIKNLPYLDFDILPTLAGTLGSGVAQEFHSFTQIYRDLPTIADILANPQITKIPQEPSAQFAVSNLIYDNLDTNTASQLMIYLDRLPIEFQILVMTDFFTANPTQAGNAAFVPWLTKNAQRLTTP